MKQFVIIGNAIAAAGCIEGIRKIDRDTKIIVVSAENRHVYCRPLISYYLEGKTDPERMKYRPDTFYSENNCDVLYGVEALHISPESSTIDLSNGSVLSYDAVCIATGSSPFVPPFTGLDNVENKYTFMTMDSALAIENAITAESRVMIIGAGLIGLKCAEGLVHRVASITVCDLANRVLSSIMDDDCAGMMQKSLEENGIRFMLEDSASRFEKNKAFMKSGKEVDFDILILAIGVRPNIGLVKDAGGAVSKGILTNDRMETSLPGIFAAGDCVESCDVSSGNRIILAIFPNAYLQGYCAGVNMAGGNAVFDHAIPMNSIGFFGQHAMTAGSYFDEEHGGCVYEERSENRIKRLFSKDGYLTGFMLVGDTERAGIYTSLVRERVPLDTVDFEMVKKSPSLLPFGRIYRDNRLGGVV